MPHYPRFAPHTTPDILDRILWWIGRSAPVIFLFAVLGVTFIGQAPIGVWLVIISAIVWFVAFVVRWLLHRFWPD